MNSLLIAQHFCIKRQCDAIVFNKKTNKYNIYKIPAIKKDVVLKISDQDVIFNKQLGKPYYYVLTETEGQLITPSITSTIPKHKGISFNDNSSVNSSYEIGPGTNKIYTPSFSTFNVSTPTVDNSGYRPFISNNIAKLQLSCDIYAAQVIEGTNSLYVNGVGKQKVGVCRTQDLLIPGSFTLNKLGIIPDGKSQYIYNKVVSDNVYSPTEIFFNSAPKYGYKILKTIYSTKSGINAALSSLKYNAFYWIVYYDASLNVHYLGDLQNVVKSDNPNDYIIYKLM